MTGHVPTRRASRTLFACAAALVFAVACADKEHATPSISGNPAPKTIGVSLADAAGNELTYEQQLPMPVTLTASATNFTLDPSGTDALRGHGYLVLVIVPADEVTTTTGEPTTTTVPLPTTTATTAEDATTTTAAPTTTVAEPGLCPEVGAEVDGDEVIELFAEPTSDDDAAENTVTADGLDLGPGRYEACLQAVNNEGIAVDGHKLYTFVVVDRTGVDPSDGTTTTTTSGNGDATTSTSGATTTTGGDATATTGADATTTSAPATTTTEG